MVKAAAAGTQAGVRTWFHRVQGPRYARHCSYAYRWRTVILRQLLQSLSGTLHTIVMPNELTTIRQCTGHGPVRESS